MFFFVDDTSSAFEDDLARSDKYRTRVFHKKRVVRYGIDIQSSSLTPIEDLDDPRFTQ